MSPRFLILAAAVLLAGWSAAAADAPAAGGAAEKPHFVYTLSPQDKVRVEIFQEEDLTSASRVDALGNVNLALVGDVHVAGLTVSDAQKVIEKAYRDGRFLVHPQVTLSIEEYATREVSIQGNVKNPGRYLLPVESTFTVVDLVTKAGGFTDIARGSDVTITRIGPDGKKTVWKVDVNSLITGKKTPHMDDASILLQAGDVVFVPERLI